MYVTSDLISLSYDDKDYYIISDIHSLIVIHINIYILFRIYIVSSIDTTHILSHTLFVWCDKNFQKTASVSLVPLHVQNINSTHFVSVSFKTFRSLFRTDYFFINCQVKLVNMIF